MHQARSGEGTGDRECGTGEDNGELLEGISEGGVADDSGELEGISEGDAVGMKEMEASGRGENWRRCLRWDSDRGEEERRKRKR
jgi:hypothetical protein